MKIKTISRTISGISYDNLSATAELEKGEDVIKASVELHLTLRQALDKIREQEIGLIQDGELPF